MNRGRRRVEREVATESPPESEASAANDGELPPDSQPRFRRRASRRVRARLARRITAQRSAGQAGARAAGRLHRELYPKADLALLQRAYDVADEQHADQIRKSGDPYITHPLAVANILAELGMDTTTLVAALLHDTVEDTGYSLDALTAEFGDEVAPSGRRRHQTRQGRCWAPRPRPRPSAR